MRKKQLIYVISTIEKIEQIDSKYFYRMHFKGFYYGQKIRSIIAKYNLNSLIVGEDYLLKARVELIKNGVLYLNILNVKTIFS